MERMERLRSAQAAVDEAHRLLRAQEAEIARLKLAGVNVSRAETLLRAFKEGARLAEEDLMLVGRSLW
jgi:uncharacterized coiled-coil DUF342 family protein